MNIKFYKKIIITFILIIWIALPVKASSKFEGIEYFPESYRPYLQELKSKHQNWNFTALYTNFDWNYVVNKENQFGKNLVPKSYSDSWKNTTQGQYNVEVDAGWVDASRQAVEYAMDPRNFLNEVRLFQFEELSYNQNTNKQSGVEKILYGTEFYNRIVEYKDANLNNIVTTKKYSDCILSAAKTSLVSSYHLASRIKQEVGPFLSHSSISGTVPGYEGLYNFYNIGATSSSEPLGAIKNGLEYAKNGKGASSQTQRKYLIPWNTKEIAITGGAIFIGSSYINIGQDNVYLQKFDVNDQKQGELFWHQYMTNVLAPYSESKSIYNGYKNSNLLDLTMNFVIPVYQNMPEYPVESPNISKNDFNLDNTKVYADVTGLLNVRTGPGTSYEVLKQIDRSEIMTRIAKGKQAGELWDKVKLSNGMIGYVFQSYLKEVSDVQISDINLSLDKNIIDKNETISLNVTIIPEEAKDKKLIYSSSDDRIARVNDKGKITGISSGKATITVSSEDKKVEKSIQIEVYTKVKDLELDIDKIIMQEGDSFQINPIVYPEDANNKNIIFSSSNNSVAKVTKEGNILAIKSGECKITAKTEEENIEKDVEVTVRKKLEEGEIVFDKSLVVNGNEITGLDDTKNTAKNIKDKITTNYTVQIIDSSGEEIPDDSFVGTNSKIIILDENEEIVMEYIIILYGDIDGDGKINSVDLLVLQRHILEIEKLNGVFLKAGNIDKNGKNPSSLDSLLIQRHILELEKIKQK